MTTWLVVLAAIVAVVNLVSSAGLLVWGLLGGDGAPRRRSDTVLGLALLVAAALSVLLCLRALDGLGRTAWLLTWAAPALAVVALVVVGRRDGEKPRDLVRWLWSPALLSVPPLLLLASGAVEG